MIGVIDYVTNKVINAGGQPWVVGGFVRHLVMEGLHGHFGPNNDIDMEVYGLDQSTFEQKLLWHFPNVSMVGKVFGVYKFQVNGIEVQINLPTIRKSSGPGHKDEEVEVIPNLPFEQACKRRNFTVNAMMLNPANWELIDLYNGVEHCRRKSLVPTSSLFSQDPLRVLNGLKLAGIYGFIPAYSLMEITKECDTSSLPIERIWGEWWNWAYRSIHPSNGIRYLGMLNRSPKLIQDMKGIPQDPEWHPEGDVWQHSMLCVDFAAYIAIRDELEPEDRAVLVLSSLCHDLGKIATTIEKDNRWVSPGHDLAGENPTREFLTSIGCPAKLQERIVELAVLHMAHVHKMGPKKLKSKLRHNSIEMWQRIVEADHSARPPLPAEVPGDALELVNQITSIPPEAIKPIVDGKSLMESFGMKPGQELGKLKNAAYEAQLDNKFDSLENGLDYIRKVLL